MILVISRVTKLQSGFRDQLTQRKKRQNPTKENEERKRKSEREVMEV